MVMAKDKVSGGNGDCCLDNESHVASPPSTSSGVDVVLLTVGKFGKWQAMVTFVLSLIKLPVAWFQLGIVFLAPPPSSPPICSRPPGENITLDLWRKISQPYSIQGNLTIYDSCKKYDLNYTALAAQGWNKSIPPSDPVSIIPCNSWEYDRSVFEETIVTEWDLICERTQLSNVAQMTFMFGVLIGNVLFGVWSDRIGRKRPLFFALILQAVTALASALVPWFEAFIVLRFLLAIATGGTMITSFVICMEIVGGWWRTAIPILYQVPFGIGQCIMAGLAYYLRNWRILQVTVALLSGIYIFSWWIIPESPRWLLAVGRRKNAMIILENAAKMNGKPTHSFNALRIEEQLRKGPQANRATEGRIVGVLDLFERPILRTIAICVFLNWLIGGLAFFGFSQYLAYLGGSLFLNVTISAIVGVPGTFACVYIVQHFGRKATIIGAQLLTGIATLLILAFPMGEYSGDWPRVLLAVIGVTGISVSFPALYLYSSELFPTVVRNSAMGIASMFARFGSMAAPFIATLGFYEDYLPPLVFGIANIAGTFLLLLLPETKDKQLPDSLQDAETCFKPPTIDEQKNPVMPDHEENRYYQNY